MNTFIVMQELQKHLQEKLKTYHFQAHEKGRPEKGHDAESDLRSPSVLIGQMPQRERDRQEIVPFVLIQAMQGLDLEGEQHVEIAFRLAVKNDDVEALEHDLHNFITVVRHALFELDKQPLVNKIKLIENEKGLLAWTRPDEQEDFYAQAFIFGKFVFPSMQ